MMYGGKKGTSERVVYGALSIVEERTRRDPVEVFEQALRNATPVLEVKPRRVGGSTYQVPVEIRGDRRQSLAMRWLIGSSRNRNGRSMSEKLAAEILDASNNVGATVKRREDTHRMAEANKAFAHYRW
jgi:small subunit ribosomal protein S7